MKFLLALLFALLPLAAMAHDVSGMTEANKIEALIVSVEQLPGAVFIRNGGEFDAVHAASHLRMKWRNAGKRVKTAEDFIRVCASESSMSGKKYQIRFADGHVVDSEQFFHDRLRQFEAGAKPPARKVASGKATAAIKN